MNEIRIHFNNVREFITNFHYEGVSDKVNRKIKHGNGKILLNPDSFSISNMNIFNSYKKIGGKDD
jgi:hypothetical protein